MDAVKTSKFLSLLLRHRPETIGLTLDSNGWANVDELLTKMVARGTNINFEALKQIVETNNKKRFVFNEDMTKIRANQGHSIEVDLQLKPAIPPDVLYHGTASKFLSSILAQGLVKRQRQHVHLSADRNTAVNVGSRHGAPVVLRVDCKSMTKDGCLFYLSENKVWLTDFVAPKYLLREEGDVRE